VSNIGSSFVETLPGTYSIAERCLFLYVIPSEYASRSVVGCLPHHSHFVWGCSPIAVLSYPMLQQSDKWYNYSHVILIK